MKVVLKVEVAKRLMGLDVHQDGVKSANSQEYWSIMVYVGVGYIEYPN
jgi:hypothetical protein